ncbi:MAG: hypothetical protein ACK5PP_15515 [Acidimicrobiales bacterium]
MSSPSLPLPSPGSSAVAPVRAAPPGPLLLRTQVRTATAARALARRIRVGLSDDRGEITSTVAIIGVLVVGALAAGAVVVARMEAHAGAIPNPGSD